MTESRIDPLIKSLAATATGYAAVIDGVLDIRTVADNEKGAAINALSVLGVPMFVLAMLCQDPECDCTTKMLKGVAEQRKRKVEIVAVKIETLKDH